jgi:phosphohistidine phosphatase
MEIWLIRHATAVARDPSREDAARPLTPKGRKRWARAVKGLGSLGVSLDALYHSPWLRAVETADALMPLLEGERVALPELATAPSERLLERLSGDPLAVVGHDPWISELLAWLVVGSRDHGRGFVLKKGGVARLDGDLRAGGMTLRALFPPQVLVELSRG